MAGEAGLCAPSIVLYMKFEFRRPYHSEDIRHFVCENYSVCDPDL